MFVESSVTEPYGQFLFLNQGVISLDTLNWFRSWLRQVCPSANCSLLGAGTLGKLELSVTVDYPLNSYLDGPMDCDGENSW